MSVLAMGPGSSGTHTMASMLRHMGLDTIHEDTMMFRLPGLKELDRCEKLKEKCPKILQGVPVESCDWEAAGDWLAERGNRALVGYPYGFMVYYLRHRVPRLPVICLHRPKDAWLKSVRGNLWRVDIADSWPLGIASFEEFWTVYHHLMQCIPSPVLHIELDQLDRSIGKVRGFLNL